MNLRIIETLNEIAKNEQEKFKAFREEFTQYCICEKAVLNLFRNLRSIEGDLQDCLEGRIEINVDRAIILKVMNTIQTELEIIRYKMKCSGLSDSTPPKVPKPVGRWTDDKLCLIELLYAIKQTKSINNGNITLKALQECFEYFFQVKLGNISDRISELLERKTNKKMFLETLTVNFNGYLEYLCFRK